MKKKGLIISTVVMVVVLIASLTTATYAWFTSIPKAEVTPIQFSVTSDSDVTIGVSTTNKIVTGDAIGQEKFRSGEGLDYTVKDNVWDGGDNSLGFAINTGLSLASMKKAIFTGTPYDSAKADTTGTIDATLQPEGTWVKASGNGTNVTKTEIVAAVANGDDTNQGDYLDVSFGVAAAKQNVTKIKCVIGVNPTGGTTLGMNAAISFVYKLGENSNKGTNWSDIQQVYDQAKYNSTTRVADVQTPAEISGITWNAGAQSFEIEIAAASEGAVLTQGAIYQIHIKLFINGKDVDCNNNAANVSSSITINFIADKTEV